MDPELMNGMPYAYPGVGSPEAGVIQQALAAPRAAATKLTPEELEGLRWNNWAQSNNFEVQDPRVQQQLVKMYNDNVLPYVASSTGGNVDVYRQQFAATYPLVAQLIGREFSEVEGRQADAALLGLNLDETRMFGAEGKLPDADKDPMLKVMAERTARTDMLTQVEAEFPGVLTEGQRVAYMLTGDPTKLEPKNAEKAQKQAVEMRANDEKIIRGLDASLTNVDHAMRAVNNAASTLGYAFDDTSTLSGEGRSFFSLPASGPLSVPIANSALPSDASTLRGYLQTVKASAVFDTLQELRANSSNGSSGLGQVTNVEIGLLGSRIAALNPDRLSEEQLAEEVRYFHENLMQIKRDLEHRRILEMENYQSVYGSAFNTSPNTRQATVPPAVEAAPAPPNAPAPPAAPGPSAAPAAPAAAPQTITVSPEEWNAIMGGQQ